MTFQGFPKIARLSRECVVSEKIDGTNASVVIALPTFDVDPTLVLARHADGWVMLAGCRTRYITPADDNFGFAAWVKAHAADLWALGEGRHFGEWWGSGIQRGYGLTKGEKRFSLFNAARWADERNRVKFPTDRPACCGVVPVLYRGPFDTFILDGLLATMRCQGSQAAPGFMQPEGIVVFHAASGTMFKKTLDRDEQPKGEAA